MRKKQPKKPAFVTLYKSPTITFDLCLPFDALMEWRDVKIEASAVYKESGKLEISLFGTPRSKP